MSPEEMAFVAAVVKPRSGLLLGADKGYFVQSRLGPVARKEGFDSVPELLAGLRTKRDERLAWAVTEALTNNETMFYRDGASFTTFRDELLPPLAAARAGGTVRVWCAGCSTGQEPYSLALLMEEAREKFEGVQLDILATDISGRCLEVAQAGVYSQFEVQRGLPIRQLVKHFVKHEDNWRLAARVRRAVVFKAQNLLEEAQLGRFDVIFCRNVLGGFDTETRAAVLDRLSRQLAPDGALLLGAGETAESDALLPVPGRPGYHVRAGSRRAAA